METYDRGIFFYLLYTSKSHMEQINMAAEKL